MSALSALEILLGKLQLPSPRELSPWLDKLLEHPDSAIIIVIEKPLGADGPHVAYSWLSSTERSAVRKGLLAVNARRAKKGQPATDEIPATVPRRTSADPAKGTPR